jgi:hypothetical protein
MRFWNQLQQFFWMRKFNTKRIFVIINNFLNCFFYRNFKNPQKANFLVCLKKLLELLYKGCTTKSPLTWAEPKLVAKNRKRKSVLSASKPTLKGSLSAHHQKHQNSLYLMLRHFLKANFVVNILIVLQVFIYLNHYCQLFSIQSLR